MSYINESGPLEAIIQAIADFGSDVGSMIKNSKNNRAKEYLDRSSISRATKDLVASFPVLCDDSISSGTAAMITKAIERNCLVMLQMLFSSAYLKGSNAREVLSQWHKNIDDDKGMDELLDLIAAFESAKDYDSIEFRQILKEFAPVFQQYLQDQRVYPISSFSENAISSFEVELSRRGDLDVRQITEDYDPLTSVEVQRFQAEQDKANQRQQTDHANLMNNRVKNNFDKDKFVAQHNMDIDNYNLQYNKFKHQIGQDDIKNQLERDKYNQQVKDSDRRYAMDVTNQYQNYLTKQLLPSDVKKVNELVPSMLILQFDAIDSNTGTVTKNYRVLKQAIVGVKARLIPCDSFEVIDHIRSIEKTKVSLLNLFRATTREISFARDFIGAVDQAKIEAKQNSKLSKTSPIWRALQNRANKSTLNRLRKNRANDAGAITTLVVSNEVSNILKKDYNIDLNLPSKAKYIMEQYNLLCLIIVDEQTQVARFLFDGEKYYQDYSFDMLERETGDGSYKKIVNLLSTINR